MKEGEIQEHDERRQGRVRGREKWTPIMLIKGEKFKEVGEIDDDNNNDDTDDIDNNNNHNNK